MPKRPFDLPQMLQLVEEAVRPFPPAAMFALAQQGYRSTFEQLVGCIISIRTPDEVSLPTAIRLLETARTPEALSRLSESEIGALIRPSRFHEVKAQQIREIARRTVRDHGGELPCDPRVLTSFRGVGPKCAHLALGIACGEPQIAVDVHVHRVTNRWGIVKTRTPEHTMEALEHLLPERYWIDLNRLLVPFGKHVCTGRLPRCSTCPVLSYCRQVGVTAHR